MLQTVGSILADYSRVAGSFDQAVRLLGDVQVGQQQQARLMDSIAQSLSRLGTGLETLTNGVSKTVTTELAATRAMIREMEGSHSSNLRLLSNNHAQTAVQIAAAIEHNAAIVERLPTQMSASLEARIDGAVREAVRPVGLTVAQQMQRIEGSFSELSRERRESASEKPRGHQLAQSSNESGISTRALEDKISEGFDRLNQNVGAAFSAYSGVLKLAVAALDKSDTNAGLSASAEPAPRGSDRFVG
jgi:hypothetical protein